MSSPRLARLCLQHHGSGQSSDSQRHTSSANSPGCLFGGYTVDQVVQPIVDAKGTIDEVIFLGIAGASDCDGPYGRGRRLIGVARPRPGRSRRQRALTPCC